MIDPTKPLPANEPEKQANNRGNQTSWKPGQSGNPNGRPKADWTWKQQLAEAVEEAFKDGKPAKYHMARAMVKEVLTGNVQAFNAITNRMDGMPLQATDITSQGEKLQAPLVVMDVKPKDK